MNKMKTILTGLFVVVLVTSCKNNEKLYKEVMDIHDDAMAKMDTIMNLKQKLSEKADSLKNDSIQDFSSELQKIQDLQNQLDSADESMMVWMREFHGDYETMAKEEIRNYLTKQKQRITEVGLFMNEAIAKAEKYLSE